MAAATDIQLGIAKVRGIKSVSGQVATIAFGAVTLKTTVTVAAGTGTDSGASVDSLGATEEWQGQEMSSTDGATTESLVAYRRARILVIDFAPSGSTKALANAIAEAIRGLGPYAVFTLAQFFDASLNTSYNYQSGGQLKYTREGWLMANVTLKSYETAGTAGTFAALTPLAVQ